MRDAMKLVVLIHHSSKADGYLEHIAAAVPRSSLGTCYFGDIISTIMLAMVTEVSISILIF